MLLPTSLPQNPVLCQIPPGFHPAVSHFPCQKHKTYPANTFTIGTNLCFCFPATTYSADVGVAGLVRITDNWVFQP